MKGPALRGGARRSRRRGCSCNHALRREGPGARGLRVWEDLKDTVEAARGCILLRRRPFHNQGGLLHQLLPEHRHAQPEAIGLLPTAVSHRLERPGPRVPWSVAAVQEELGLGYAHRYTDSRSHIKPEAKAAVDEAKLRYAALPPAGLVHEVAEISGCRQAWSPGPGPGPAPPPRGYSNAQMLPFVSGVCFAAAAGQSLDRAQRRCRRARGHGRRIFDDNDRDVKPADVRALRRALGLWHLDDKGRVGDER
ncbi:hypothetical protein NHJ13051_000245 [Beauveria bassiana]